MEKDCLKSKTGTKKISVYLIAAGILLATGMGISAYSRTRLTENYGLQRNEAGNGSYLQEVVAIVDGEKTVSLTVDVEEQQFTEAEAEQVLKKAEGVLDELLKGENADFSNITEALCFAEEIPDLPVSVTWSAKPSQYFDSAGNWKEEVQLLEPVEVQVRGILSCQSYDRDYERTLILQPRERTMQAELLAEILEQTTQNGEWLMLPQEYQGKNIYWKKPMDWTFLYVLFLTVGAVVFLQIAEKRDEKILQKARLEQFERDYPQVISKFTMLLSAGLSIRNAWERIVKIYRKKKGKEKLIYEEMSHSLREMEKGTLETEVYETFGNRIGDVHYKKLMALFVSDKKRGSIPLLDTMNRELLSAWEEQKRKTKQQGEKIGTKLLFPMMGMLLVVFLMILIPAFLSFQ